MQSNRVLKKKLIKKSICLNIITKKITSNQNLIEFNNTTYVIEFLKDSILNHVNGHCYLFNQQNLDFDSLKIYLIIYMKMYKYTIIIIIYY